MDVVVFVFVLVHVRGVINDKSPLKNLITIVVLQEQRTES